ncbi:MAG: DNA polymerase III subunit delta [Chloroflexi bacterium]|nr:DNA polymerase III subunit delta [Chloroflexota bacterium]
MIRILHGTDEFSVSERLIQIRAAAGPPEVMMPNTNVFEGDGYSRDELLGAASAIPFLADKRLVIVKGLLGRIEANTGRNKSRTLRVPKGDWTGLGDVLPTLPPSTELVFVDGELRKNGAGLKTVGSTATTEQFDISRGQALDTWIAERFRSEGATASRSAVERLADLIGGQTRLLAQEIGKLSLYANGRPIQPDDIDLMVAPAREANIFAAVDAVLDSEPTGALRAIHQLLDEGNSIHYLLTMLARQTRMTLVAQDMMQSGAAEADIAKRIGVRENSFPLRKTLQQARSHPHGYLAWIHRQLLEADVGFKTSSVGNERSAAELLVARLSTAR